MNFHRDGKNEKIFITNTNQKQESFMMWFDGVNTKKRI